MAKRAATIDIGINIPAGEITKAEKQLSALFNTSQSFNKNPINSKAFTQPLGRITGAANEFNKSLEASNARVIAFGASAGAIFAVQNALQQLVRTTIEVEQKLTNIQVLLGKTGNDFQRFTDGLYKAAQTTGQSFSAVAESAEELARQGLNVEQTLKRTTAAMTLAKLGGMDVKNATESLTAALNTFGKSAGDATTVVNKLAQVDAAFAVSSGDLAEAIKRTGAAAVSANVSFEELISVVTTAQEKTARGGAVIGNSFKTIFTRIQRPETLKQLKTLGVVVEDSNRQMLPAIQILRNYAKVYDNLGPRLKATTSEMLAGVFQVNVLKAVLPDLAQETGRFDKALNVANQTTNEATKRLAILTSTTEGTLNATLVNLTKFAKEVGDLTIKPAIDRILKLLNGMADLIGPKNFFGLGETIGTAVYQGMGKVIGGPGLLLLGAVLVKIGARLAVFIKDAAAGFMGLETSSQKLANIQNIISNVLAERPKLINQATASEEGMVAVARVLADKIKHSRQEMERLKVAAEQAAPAVLAMQGGAKKAGGKRKGGSKAGGFVPGFASGFVPNFNMAAQERRLAESGGYQAGKIKQATIPGVGKVTYNGNEDIKQMPGLEQPAIMPPALSNAGRNYREAFRGTHGYDPYNMGHGFVPNFAPMIKLSSLGQTKFGGKKELAQSSVTKYYKKGEFDDAWLAQDSGYSFAAQKAKKDHRDKMTGTRDSAFTHIFDTQGKIGLLGFAGDYKDRSASARMKIKDISAMKELRERVPGLANDMMVFDNVQVSNISEMNRMQKSEKKPFFDRISDFLAQPLANLADSFSRELLGNQGKLDTKAIAGQLKGQNSLMPPGAEGDIFEAVLRIMTTQPKHLRKAFDSQRNFKAPFDFEEGANVGATPKFKEAFGFDTRRYLKADAKRSATQDTINSLVKKGINQYILNPQGKFAAMFQNVPGMSSGSGIAAGVSGGKQFISEKERSKAAKRVGNLKGKALGFVPNFAAVGSKLGAEQNAAEIRAVSSAVSRENEAGVPLNKIRVGTDKRLGGGIGVFNTSEGSLENAINMHMAAGASLKDIQTMGKAMGFVPNFATGASGGGRDVMTNATMMILMGQLEAFGSTAEESEGQVKSFGDELMSGVGQLAKWYFGLSIAADMMGGWTSIMTKSKAMITKFTGALATSFATLRSYSGARGGSLVGDMMFGQAGRRGGMRGGFNQARGAYRSGSIAAGRQGAGVLGRARAGLGVMGRTAGGAMGMVGRGGAALLGGGAATIGAGVGVAAGIGYALYKRKQKKDNAEAIAAFKAISDSSKASTKHMEELTKTIDKLGKGTAGLREALSEGDEGQAQAETENLVRTINSSPAMMKAIENQQGPMTLGGQEFADASTVLSKLSTGGLLPEQIEAFTSKLMEAETAAKSLKDNVSGASAILEEYRKSQNFFGSDDLSSDKMKAAAAVMAEAMSKAGDEEIPGLLQSFKDLRTESDEVGDKLNKSEMKGLSASFTSLSLTNKNLTKEQKELIKQYGALSKVTNNNEEDQKKMHNIILDEVITALEMQVKGAKAAAKVNVKVAKSQANLYEVSRGLIDVMRDTTHKMKMDHKLEELMEEHAIKMFDVGTKGLTSMLKQTASELSVMEFKNIRDLQALEMDNQNKIAEAMRNKQSSILDAFKANIANSANNIGTESTQFQGLVGDAFQQQVMQDILPDMQKAIGAGDLGAAQKAIEDALLNTMAGAPAGGEAIENPEFKKVLTTYSNSLKEAVNANVENLSVLRKEFALRKERLKAEQEVARSLLKLSQEIKFAGGASGVSGNPYKSLAELESNNRMLKTGRALGAETTGRDMETNAMIKNAKLLASLTIPGGGNPASEMVGPLAEIFQKNLATYLEKAGLKDIVRPDQLKQIATSQAENLIKPDKDLADIHTELSKQKFTAGAAHVIIDHIAGQAYKDSQNTPKALGGGGGTAGGAPTFQAMLSSDGTYQVGAGTAGVPLNSNRMGAFHPGGEREAMQRNRDNVSEGLGDIVTRRADVDRHRGSLEAAIPRAVAGAKMADARIKELDKELATLQAAQAEAQKFGAANMLKSAEDRLKRVMDPAFPKQLREKAVKFKERREKEFRDRGQSPAGKSTSTPFSNYDQFGRATTAKTMPLALTANRQTLANEVDAQRRAAQRFLKHVQGVINAPGGMRSAADIMKDRSAQVTLRDKGMALADNLRYQSTAGMEARLAALDTERSGLEAQDESILALAGERSVENAKLVGEEVAKRFARLRETGGAGFDSAMAGSEKQALQDLIKKLSNDGVFSFEDMGILREALNKSAEKVSSESQRKNLGIAFRNKNMQPTQGAFNEATAALDKLKSMAPSEPAQKFGSLSDELFAFGEANRDTTAAVNASQAALKVFEQTIEAQRKAGTSEIQIRKLITKSIKEFQDNINFEEYKSGVQNLEQFRAALSENIAFRLREGETIQSQLLLLEKAEAFRRKEVAAAEELVGLKDFIEESSESIITLGRDFRKLNIDAETAGNAEKELMEKRREIMKDGKVTTEELEEFRKTLGKVGLSADEVRNKLGIITTNELYDKIFKVFTESEVDPAKIEEAKKSFAELQRKVLGLDETPEEQKKRILKGTPEAPGIFTRTARRRSGEFGIGGTVDLSNQALIDERIARGGDPFKLAGELTKLDKQRVEIGEKLAAGKISEVEASLRLANAQAELKKLNLADDFSSGVISAKEFASGIQELNDGLRQGTAGVKGDFGTIKEEIGNLFLLDRDYKFNQTKEGLKDVFSTLRDGTKGALKEVIMGTASMKEAFQKVFASIGEKMLDRTIGMFVDSIFYLGTGFLRRNQGGVVGYNGGGVVQGGSGVRDDVPALLTKGEYVVRKSAVNKYGSGFLEKINSGKIRKYQDGGSASFNLMNQFDYNSPRRPTAGTMNVDSRMSAFAQTDTNNPMNQLKFDKEQTLDSYLKEKAAYEEQKRQAMAAYKKQRKGIIKQALISIALAGVQQKLGEYIDKKMVDAASKPVGDLGTSLGKGDNIKKVSAAAHNVSPQEATAVMREYRSMVANNPKLARRMEIYAKRGGAFSLSPATGGGLGTLRSGRPSGAFGYGNPYRIDYQRKSKGGVMGPRGGGSDNIPALLTGGEYVVNKRSVDHYGLKFMEDLNKGRLPGFNRGGLVGEGGNGTPTATGTGGAPSNVNNNITINVTVEKDGNVSTDTTNEQAGGNQNTQGALQEEERNKQFSGAIKDAVVREIVEQKRPGGLLYNEKRTNS